MWGHLFFCASFREKSTWGNRFLQGQTLPQMEHIQSLASKARARFASKMKADLLLTFKAFFRGKTFAQKLETPGSLTIGVGKPPPEYSCQLQQVPFWNMSEV